MTETVVVAHDCGSQTVNNFDYSKLKNRDYAADDYQVDKSVAEGLKEDRRCTDCFFLLIWFAFLVGMLAMTIDGYDNGQGEYMLAPISQSSTVCGYGLMSDYPVLYVPNLYSATEDMGDFFEYGYCAMSCPSQDGEAVTCTGDGEHGNPDGADACVTYTSYATT